MYTVHWGFFCELGKGQTLSSHTSRTSGLPAGVFSKVQIQLARSKRVAGRNNKKNDYLLGGVIEFVCGFARTGDPANSSLYYRCTDRLNNACGLRQCFEHGINAPVLDTLVWNNIKDLLTQPELVFEQARCWQDSASPLQLRLITLEERLKRLDEAESRYAKMYGDGMMTERIYRDRFTSLNENRRNIIDEISVVNDELAHKPSVPLEKLVDGVIKLVEDLDFSDKKEIIQKVVTKIIATKKEVTVWGHLPVLATEKVGLDAKYSNCYKINLPFEIKIQMPATDLGKKGYSPNFAERLEKELGYKV